MDPKLLNKILRAMTSEERQKAATAYAAAAVQMTLAARYLLEGDAERLRTTLIESQQDAAEIDAIMQRAAARALAADRTPPQ